MTLKAEKIILRNKFSNIDSFRKMYIENIILDSYSDQQLDYFFSKLTDDELLYALEFWRIVLNEKKKDGEL